MFISSSKNKFTLLYPYETSSAAVALQNGFKKRYKRAVKALGCSSRKFWLQWKAL